jgi:hypothetical protein
LLATLSLWAAEETLPDELLEKYYQVEVVVTGNGKLLEKATIGGPPTPPLNFIRPTVSKGDIKGEEEGSTLILPVPAFNWSFGCSATTASMIAGYYDRTGYPNVYIGPTNGGVMPLDNSSWPDVVINGETRHQCPLSATRKGLDGRTNKGHVDDYWVKYGSESTDPYYGNWTEHTYGSCTGDYMKTNQWYHNHNNSDGSTTFYNYTNGAPLTAANMEGYGIAGEDGGYGFKLFLESRGYTITTMYNQLIDTVASGGFTFAQYKAEIDAHHPVLIHVTGHTMAGVGYNTSGNVVYLHDTWDYSIHTMTWGGSYSGMDHKSVTIINISGGGAPSTGKSLSAIYYLLGS